MNLMRYSLVETEKRQLGLKQSAVFISNCWKLALNLRQVKQAADMVVLGVFIGLEKRQVFDIPNPRHQIDSQQIG
jgi:hypothetical protein